MHYFQDDNSMYITLQKICSEYDFLRINVRQSKSGDL